MEKKLYVKYKALKAKVKSKTANFQERQILTIMEKRIATNKSVMLPSCVVPLRV